MHQRAKPPGISSYVIIYCLLALGIGTAGYLHYESQKQEIKRISHKELYAIAELKVRQISGWREERLEDAAVIGSNPMSARAVHDWLLNPKKSLEEEILLWMRSIKEHHDYDTVLLADTQGNAHLTIGEGDRIDESLRDDLLKAVETKAPALSRLYRSPSRDGIRLCLFTPVLMSRDTEVSAVGVLLLMIDPHEFLYPLIQSWPTPSKTAETLLVRRDGDVVLYMNELRHQKGTAFSLARPLEDPSLPSARAVQWEEGLMEGVDYRGATVLASMRSIPGSQWFLVAKVDAEEVYAPIREYARQVSFAVAAMMGGAAAALFLIWSRQQQGVLRKARDELERRVEERTEELAKANEALRLDELRLQAMLELSQLSEASTKDIMDFALEHQVRLTRSEAGFLGFMNEDETVFTRYAWSSGVTDRCRILDRAQAHQQTEGAGLWAEALRRREPVIVNDYAHHPHKAGRPEGHLPLTRIMSIPVFDGNRIVAIAVVANKDEPYDTSDVRQLTLLMDEMWRLLQRQRAEKALRDAENLAAIGRALSGVAHDMKTPLIAIGGFTQMVRRHLEKGNPDREKLGIVVKETRRLENMVKDMLDFSRPLELERNEHDIRRVVEESIAIAEAAASGKRVKVQTECARDLAPVPLDALRIEQVLINLLVNAIQASPEGEVVLVKMDRHQGKLLIDVIDRGCGIPPEKRDEVFLPFVSTKSDGTGLGLAIVKKIVEAHRGEIRILDNPEKGLTFRVVLPGGEQSPSAHADSAPEPVMPPVKSGIGILHKKPDLRPVPLVH